MSKKKSGSSLTDDQVEKMIARVHFSRPPLMRIASCTITLVNGSAVMGYSDSAPEFDGKGNPIGFDSEVLNAEARKKAIESIKNLPAVIIADLLAQSKAE